MKPLAEVLAEHEPVETYSGMLGAVIRCHRCGRQEWTGLSVLDGIRRHDAAVVSEWLKSDEAQAVASKAVLRERHRRWDHPHQGECITDARAALAALAEHAKGDADE